MATNQTNDQDHFDSIARSVSSMDTQRATELVNTRKMQVITNNALVKELARLTAKYGQDDARVTAISTRIAYNPMILASLDQETGRLAVQQPAFDPSTWQLTGRVFDSKGSSVKNMTVFITEDGTNAFQGIGFSCTDVNGAYAINVTGDYVSKLKIINNLRVAVSDSNKKNVYTSKETFTPVAGMISNYFIYLQSDQCVAPPSTPPGNNIQ